jgi:hypothetical protein
MLQSGEESLIKHTHYNLQKSWSKRKPLSVTTSKKAGKTFTISTAGEGLPQHILMNTLKARTREN